MLFLNASDVKRPFSPLCDWVVRPCPTATTAAFPRNQKGERWERMISVSGKRQPSTAQLFWGGFPNMAYMPSTVAPAGLTPGGL